VALGSSIMESGKAALAEQVQVLMLAGTRMSLSWSQVRFVGVTAGCTDSSRGPQGLIWCWIRYQLHWRSGSHGQL
jgi:hypothetical protein